MQHNITILFYTRVNRKRDDDKVPIYLRITLNGKRIDEATHRFVIRSQWSSTAGKMKGSHAAAKTLNNFLDALRNKVHNTEREWCRMAKKLLTNLLRTNGLASPKSPT